MRRLSLRPTRSLTAIHGNPDEPRNWGCHEGKTLALGSLILGS
jgi:hypothetical protein